MLFSIFCEHLYLSNWICASSFEEFENVPDSFKKKENILTLCTNLACLATNSAKLTFKGELFKAVRIDSRLKSKF